MTTRERILAVYRGQTPDVVPYMLDLSHWFYHKHHRPCDRRSVQIPALRNWRSSPKAGGACDKTSGTNPACKELHPGFARDKPPESARVLSFGVFVWNGDETNHNLGSPDQSERAWLIPGPAPDRTQL